MRLMPRSGTVSRIRSSLDRRSSSIVLSPVSWGVNETRGWGSQLEAERVLAEIASLGERRVEAGPAGFLPDRSDAARRLVKRHGLKVVAGPVRAVLHHHDIRGAELAHIDGHAAWLASLGAQTLVLTVIASRSDEPSDRELSSSGWAHLLSAIGSVQHVCVVHKLRLAVLPRHGSMIQGPGDIERLMVGSEAGVCIDIAQLSMSGADPADVVELAAGRIQHVHVNDFDRRIAEQVRDDRLDYATAVEHGLFKPLGAGDGDVASVVEALRSSGYRGCYGLESEVRLGSVDDDPAANVRTSLEQLRALLPAAGTKG